MNYELRSLMEALNEKGIHVIADRAFDKIEIDFSEHDKKVAEEKDKRIAELERDLNRLTMDLKNRMGQIYELKEKNEELDRMLSSWIGTATKRWEETVELERKIEDLEAIIADGKKPDISVSENGVSVGCECGGYHLAKERIEVLEKENSELDHMRKSWMETAQKWSELNSKLQDKIARLECSSKIISELEDRHQSDCIRINQLLTTIDVLTERYQKLREIHGL